MHPDNHLYGHAHVLAQAVGCPTDRLIVGHVQHGWSVDTGLSDRRRLVRWLPKLLWADRHVRAAAAARIPHVIPIGAPFLYLRSALKPAPCGQGEGRTLVYPYHGWSRQPVIGPHDRYLAEVAEREAGRTVTVCLHEQEYSNLNLRAQYEEHGFRVLTHGSRLDPTFLQHQAAEIGRHERVVSNNVATAVWYAAAMGVNVEVYGPPFSVQSLEVAEQWGRYQRRTWPDLVRAGGVAGRDAAVLADEELGVVFQREPAELKELLGLDRPRVKRSVARVASRAEHHMRRAIAVARDRVSHGPDANWIPPDGVT